MGEEGRGKNEGREEKRGEEGRGEEGREGGRKGRSKGGRDTHWCRPLVHALSRHRW